MDYFVLQPWISQCVKKRKKKAGSSLIRSPSRSRGHSSCRRHPVQPPSPSRPTHGFRPALTFIPPSLPPPLSWSGLSPTLSPALSANFTPHPIYRVTLYVLQQQSQTGSPRNVVGNCIAYLKDDNTIRPGFNNASAVKSLHLRGGQQGRI